MLSLQIFLTVPKVDHRWQCCLVAVSCQCQVAHATHLSGHYKCFM
jgi:hypothetical protein